MVCKIATMRKYQRAPGVAHLCSNDFFRTLKKMNKCILYALLAAAAFGASTPFAKILVGAVAPIELAGLLYLGSGLGLLAWFVVRSLAPREAHDASSRLKASDMPWLTGAILLGGIAGPVLLMLGLTRIPGSYASLLLNMEGVLTSLLAWFPSLTACRSAQSSAGRTPSPQQNWCP
jgi:drug/metabolite transporter (DMT)-like permease